MAKTQFNFIKLIFDLAKTIMLWGAVNLAGLTLLGFSGVIVRCPWVCLSLCTLGNFAFYFLNTENNLIELNFEHICISFGLEMIFLLICPEFVVIAALVLIAHEFLSQLVAGFCQLLNMSWTVCYIKCLMRLYAIECISICENILRDTSNILFNMTKEMGKSLYLTHVMLTPWLLRSLLNCCVAFKLYTADQAVLDIENEIMRLELSDTISGLQKGDILRKIWRSVLVDLGNDEHLSIQDALDRPYDFNFKGQAFQMSYRQVAAVKRQKHVEFDLNESNIQGFSLFSSTTNKTLQHIPAYLTLANN